MTAGFLSKLVSIPLWFDYNEEYLKEGSLKVKSQFHYGSITTVNIYLETVPDVKSQFHYGSITTLVFPLSSLPLSSVSIPLWFDYNIFKFNYHFHFNPVSIPLWFDYNIIVQIERRRLENVSIPLWFDYNYRKLVNLIDKLPNGLNSTMVRLQL